jgi:hypothetical protein
LPLCRRNREDMDTDTDEHRPDMGDGRASITSQGTATRLLEAQRARKVAQVRSCVETPPAFHPGCIACVRLWHARRHGRATNFPNSLARLHYAHNVAGRDILAGGFFGDAGWGLGLNGLPRPVMKGVRGKSRRRISRELLLRRAK